MIFGPILNAEMIRLARQRRWYVLRFLVGLFLLLVIFFGYQSAIMSRLSYKKELNSDDLYVFSLMVLIYIAVGQAIAVMFLAPALVAGAIAEEKQKKTLHYLLASRLTSFEIVFGKLAARLLVVILPIALGVPILAMVCTLGGVEPLFLLMIYGVTLSTAVFEASIAILISTLVRRGREALLLTFLIAIFWFAAPTILRSLMLGSENKWADLYERRIAPVNDHLIALGPLSLVNNSPTPMLAWQGAMIARGWRMVGHQAVGVCLMLGLAVWQLRPAFRRQTGGAAQGISASRALRWLVPKIRPRPACGDSAMIWKETHGAAGSRLSLLVSFLSLVVIALIAYENLKDIMPAAWSELIRNGYRVDDYARKELNATLRAVTTMLFVTWSVLLSVHAATSISKEREDDTWVSLVSTPLSSRAILDAKIVGSLWMSRHIAYAIVAVWLFGLMMGAFHPIGVLISAVHLVVFGLLFVAGGTLISLGAKTTMRSLGFSLGMLLALSLGVPMVISLIFRDGPASGVSSPPYIFACGLLSYQNTAELIYRTRINNDPRFSELQEEIAWFVKLGTLVYLVIAPLLVFVAYRQFDRLLDRPRRGKQQGTPIELTSAARGATGQVGLPGGRA
jgi:ABC-type transport system involved in multi-copper enzyme maturation permease subunit